MGSNEKVDIKVGLFVALGLSAVLFAILALSGQKSFFKDYYTLKVKFDQVSGLAPGNIVAISGMPVGNVTDISFSDKEHKLIVSLDVDKSLSHLLTTSALASLKTQGALGDKYVYITPGSPSDPLIPENGFIQAEGAGDLFDVIADKGGDLANIIEVINEIHVLLKNINAENRSAQLMSNLVEATARFKELMSSANAMVKDIRGETSSELKETLSRLNSIAKKIDSGQGTLGALINDPTLHDRLTAFLGESPRNKYLKPLIRATIKKQDENRKSETKASAP